MTFGTLLVIPRLLWGALFVSTFIYPVILHLLRPVEEPVSALVPSLGVVALGNAVLSFVLPWWLHRKGAAAPRLEIEEIADPNASVILRADAPKIRVFADRGAAMRKAIALYFVPLVLALALTESIAVFGFVLGLRGAGWPVVLPFFAVTYLLFAVRFPRRASVLGPLEQACGAKLPPAT